MKNRFWVLSLLIFGASAFAGLPNPVGQYKMGRSDPAGGTNLFVRENGHFAIVFFGGAIVGEWRQQGSELVLKPFNPAAPFSVHGRYNPNLNKGMRLMFRGYEWGNVLVGEKAGKMRSVLNDDAGCLKSPLVYAAAEKPQKLSFLKLAGKGNKGFYAVAKYYQSDTGRYNDFIVTHYRLTYQDQRYTITDRGLVDNNRPYVEIVKSSDEIDKYKEEDLKQIESYVLNATVKVHEALWVNPQYKFHIAEESASEIEYEDQSVISLEDYRFDPKGNAYLRKMPDAEQKPEDYENSNIIYRYEKLSLEANDIPPYQVLKKPLLLMKCK